MGSSRPAEKGGRLGRPEACCKPPSWRRRGARTPHRPAGPRRRSPHHSSRAPRFSGSRCSSSPEARHVQDPWGASGDPPATGSPGSPPPWGPVPLTAPAPTPRKQGHLQQEPGQAHAHPEVHTASRSWHQALPQHAWPSPRLLGPESVLLRGGLHGTRSGLPGPQSQPPCVRPTLSSSGWGPSSPPPAVFRQPGRAQHPVGARGLPRATCHPGSVLLSVVLQPPRALGWDHTQPDGAAASGVCPRCRRAPAAPARASGGRGATAPGRAHTPACHRWDRASPRARPDSCLCAITAGPPRGLGVLVQVPHAHTLPWPPGCGTGFCPQAQRSG